MGILRLADVRCGWIARMLSCQVPNVGNMGRSGKEQRAGGGDMLDMEMAAYVLGLTVADYY